MRKLILLLLLCSGCVAGEFYTSPEGNVVSIEGDLVCVVYPVLSGKGGRVYNCYFFKSGHKYSLGDTYPDFEKHTKKSYTFEPTGNLKITGNDFNQSEIR